MALRESLDDEKSIIINMMHISVYICRKSRTTTKLVARKETTVKEYIHQDLENRMCIIIHIIITSDA